MSRLLLRAVFRHSKRHWLQLMLMILGVALGVAVMVAIDVTNQSAERAFDLSTDTLVGRATHHIVGGPSGLDDATYVTLRNHGIRTVAPVVEGYATLVTKPGHTLRLLGIDPLAESSVRPWLSAALTARTAQTNLLVEFLTRRNAVVVGGATAIELGVAVGDSLPIRIGRGVANVEIISVVGATDDPQDSALADLLLVDIATAQELLGTPGRLTRIELCASEEADILAEDTDTLANDAGTLAKDAGTLVKIRRSLPPGARVVAASAQRQTTYQMTRAFRLNLTAMSLLALVVSMFLIYNTMTFSVVQRRSLFGLLRALGATRAQIFQAIVLEATLVGLVGTALGLVAGVVLSTELIRLVTQTINDLYFVLTVRDLQLTPLTLFKGLALGLLATVGAAIMPAIEATRAPPRTTLQRVALEARAKGRAPQLALSGVFLMLASAALLAATRAVSMSLVGLFGLLAGCALLAPVITVIAARAATRPMAALLGVVGRMAARSIEQSLSRTGVAIAALMIAVSVIVGVGVMIQSFRLTVDRWLQTTLQADIYISPPTSAGTRSSATLDPLLVSRLVALGGVADWGTVRHVEVATNIGDVALAVFVTGEHTRRAFNFESGNVVTAWQQFDHSNVVLVTEPLAYRHNLKVGDTLTLTADEGPAMVQIVGVVYDYASDQGGMLISRHTYEALFRDRAISGVSLVAAPDVDVDELIRRVRSVLGPEQAAIVQSNRHLRDSSLAVFDRTFTVTAVLKMLATGVAFIGVLSALLALALERGRELAMLRAIGLEPRQVWTLVLGQTTLIGLIAGIMAVGVGLLQAYVMIAIINKRSFGWSLEMHIDPSLLVQAIMIAVTAALVAGVFPATRLATVNPATALRDE